MTPGAKDVKFINFSLSFHGEVLIQEADLELNYGRRYGLLGRNGSGKSTFLKVFEGITLKKNDASHHAFLKGACQPRPGHPGAH